MSDTPLYLEEGSLEVDDSELPLIFEEPRHTEPIVGDERVEHSWRLKEKYKTHCVALVLCLNVGVDPPDVVKTQPCARVECWIDPLSLSPTKALESIGHALQAQYERWQPRARYKQSLDPTCEDVKKLCCSLRRNAKDERVLFHYNGHGVPRPTSQGEIWVFNRTYTQYIPLSLYDLQSWMGAPSLYVYDCSSAGLILDSFRAFADQHDRDYQQQMSKSGGAPSSGPVSYRNCLQLGACAAGQALPQHPELPADLFTACLTTPVKMAVKWFVLRHPRRHHHHDLHLLIDKIPGQVSDRRTMLGELNWVFTAITDTIAWSSLPADLFQRLFRADLLTASLCRNFLLADRIMRSYNCTPVSSPALPSLARHPLWAAWDQALDLALAQLPRIVARGQLYRHSPFFRDQLTAFQVWLSLGGGAGAGARRPPDQLPMVLQVLLSTVHRVRALQLLCGFLALGGWAARQVLHVGIFPYMLKLLQASAPDLRPTMVYIWARLVAADPSCQQDLVNAKGHKYFLQVLQDATLETEHRTLAAFVLGGIVDRYPAGQEAALNGSMISVCLEQLSGAGDAGGARGAALQAWCALALARLWRGNEPARWAGVRDNAHEKLLALQSAACTSVRAAAAAALGSFVLAGLGAPRTEHANAVDQQVGVALAARARLDASALVRQEIVAALQWLVLIFEQYFIAVATQERRARSTRVSGGSPGRVDPGQDALAAGGARRGRPPSPPPLAAQPPPQPALPTIGFGSVYMKLWACLTALGRDPHPRVAAMAQDVLGYIVNQVDSVGRDFELVRSGSSSLPPSPDTRPDARPALGHRRGRSGLASTSEDSPSPAPPGTPSTVTPSPAPREHRDSASSGGAGVSCSSTGSSTTKRAIVSTEFIEWMSAVFIRSAGPPGGAGGGGGGGAGGGAADRESRAYQQRQWRRTRNARIRREAKGLGGAAARPDGVSFHSRCALPPAVLLFHPYDQHLAIASKDNFGIWDWGTGARLTHGAWRRGAGRITALLYLNTHDRALLAVAAHTGAVHVYRPGGSSAEPALAAAWRALDVRPAPAPRPPPAQPAYSFSQLVSEQFLAGGDGGAGGAGAGAGGELGGAPRVLLAHCARDRWLAVGGLARHVRLWDLASELVRDDIDTESEAGVSSLWRGAAADSALTGGMRDGSVRVWDVRQRAPAARLRDHRAPVLAAALRPDTHVLASASADGELLFYDTRTRAVRARARAPGPLAAADVHPLANLLACGSVNQCISLWDLSGAALHSIKFHEGFMGARIGPAACLAFHPLRCALGVGSKDSTVSVYVSERR